MTGFQNLLVWWQRLTFPISSIGIVTPITSSVIPKIPFGSCRPPTYLASEIITSVPGILSIKIGRVATFQIIG